jgi:hypothetical protein
MRLTTTVLGHQLLDITIDRDRQVEDEVEHGVPFGFSGGSICQAERAAEDWLPLDEELAGHPGGGGLPPAGQ